MSSQRGLTQPWMTHCKTCELARRIKTQPWMAHCRTCELPKRPHTSTDLSLCAQLFFRTGLTKPATDVICSIPKRNGRVVPYPTVLVRNERFVFLPPRCRCLQSKGGHKTKRNEARRHNAVVCFSTLQPRQDKNKHHSITNEPVTSFFHEDG